MALFLHSNLHSTLPQPDATPRLRQRKISIALINNPPGKNCLARKNCPVKSIFTLARQCTASRLFGPASPAASPESEYVSHGCVASPGVCKGPPQSNRVRSECSYRRWRLRRRDVETAVRLGRSGIRGSTLQPAAQGRSQASRRIPCRCREQRLGQVFPLRRL